MRRARSILKDLGFNEQAPEGSRNAFLKHLMKHAADSLQKTESAKPVTEISSGEQLSFDPKILNTIAK